jgi:hypothetical protein
MLPLREMQPIATFQEPARTGIPVGTPRTYIYCGRPGPGDTFRTFLRKAQADAGWRHREIDASHSPHVTAPELLAEVLDGIAAGRPS